MKSAKEIKEELEKEHGWNFSSEENMEMYYDLFLDVQKVVLRQTPVIGEVCDNCGEGKPAVCAKCCLGHFYFR